MDVLVRSQGDYGGGRTARPDHCYHGIVVASVTERLRLHRLRKPGHPDMMKWFANIFVLGTTTPTDRAKLAMPNDNNTSAAPKHAQPVQQDTPRTWVSELEFSDRTRIALAPDDVVVIVGPNNSAKSATLRAIRDFFRNGEHASPVLTSLRGDVSGEYERLIERLNRFAVPNTLNDQVMYKIYDEWVAEPEIRRVWNDDRNVRGAASRLFCLLLNAEARLEGANPCLLYTSDAAD